MDDAGTELAGGWVLVDDGVYQVGRMFASPAAFVSETCVPAGATSPARLNWKA